MVLLKDIDHQVGPGHTDPSTESDEGEQNTVDIPSREAPEA